MVLQRQKSKVEKLSSLTKLRQTFSYTREWILSRRGVKEQDGLPRLVDICNALCSHKSEIVGLALSQEFHRLYGKLTPGEKRQFYQIFRKEFSPSSERVLSVVEDYWLDNSPENARLLHEAAEAPRQKIIRTLNCTSDSMRKIVGMREDLIAFVRDDSSLDVVDRDFRHVLASWFNNGFLTLKKIDWDSPAQILEQLIQYESVHDIRGWEDLRRRLESDRRCYGFFHPAMEDRILIFVEVALTNELSGDVSRIIESNHVELTPSAFDTAIFYSINNCQRGLKGISFGNFLIKRVVKDLIREFPRITTFSTLSPIPGFCRWLLTDAALQPLEEQVLKASQKGSLDLSSVPDDVRAGLERHCADYLVNAKGRDGRPKDSVARFHLGNGARLERLNWAGDQSNNGIRQSMGFMVNYLYDLCSLENNHETYFEDGEIHCGREFKVKLALSR